MNTYKYLGEVYEVPQRLDEPYKLSKKGREKLDQCHTPLRLCVEELLHYMDVCVIEGYRSREDQEKAYREGKSNASFGFSPHNYNPSFAVDIYPYPIPQIEKNGKKIIDDNSKEWDKMAALMNMISLQKGINLKWGGTFKIKKDGKLVPFVDKPHFELANYKQLLTGPSVER